jgi:Leucine-rich repeat (LRR) protein
MLQNSCQVTGDCLVQLGIGDIFTALGFLLALAVQTWGLTRFLISRMDSQKEKLESQIEKNRTESSAENKLVHDRINTVKDQYVKREDIDRDLAQIQRSVSDVNANVNAQMSGVNNRLDHIVSIMTKTNG